MAPTPTSPRDRLAAAPRQRTRDAARAKRNTDITKAWEKLRWARRFEMPATMEPAITLPSADSLTHSRKDNLGRAAVLHRAYAGDLARVERERERAEAKAVDPLSTVDEESEGSGSTTTCGFDAVRLTASVSRLIARLEEISAKRGSGSPPAAVRCGGVLRDEASQKMRTLIRRRLPSSPDALTTFAEAEAAVRAATQKQARRRRIHHGRRDQGQRRRVRERHERLFGRLRQSR